jgi:hypothetical protein
MLFGYTSLEDFITTLFKGVQNETIIKIITPIILGIDIIFSFVFDSVGGIWFLILLYIIDFLTGVAKSINYSIKIKKLKIANKYIPHDLLNKKLVSKRFPRFLLTMFAALMLLGLISLAGKFSIIYMPLFSIFYSIFLGQQLISIIENLSELKLISTATYKKLIKKITEYKND